MSKTESMCSNNAALSSVSQLWREKKKGVRGWVSDVSLRLNETKDPSGRSFLAYVPEHKGDGVKVGCQHIGQD